MELAKNWFYWFLLKSIPLPQQIISSSKTFMCMLMQHVAGLNPRWFFFFFFRLPSRFVLFFHKFYSLTESFSRVSNCQKSLIRYCGSVYIIPKFIVKTIFWVFSWRRDGDVIKYPLWIFEISSLILKCLIIAVIVVKNLHKIYIYNVLYYT